MTQATLDFGRPLGDVPITFSDQELHLFSDLVSQLRIIYGERLISVKLVGSRARGTATEKSDYDFLVFLDECDYAVEVPKLQNLGNELHSAHGLGPHSLSPLSAEQFVGLDAKYAGITDNFRRDAIILA